MMKKLLIATMMLLAAGGCSAGENIEAVDREVARFHRLAAGGQHDRLYGEAADEFRRAATQRDFRDLLLVIDERLGAVQRANRQGWHVNYTPGGAVVTLNYDTQFERGRGTEQFVYRVADERPLLLGYHVNSPALMARPSNRQEEAERNASAEEDAPAE